MIARLLIAFLIFAAVLAAGFFERRVLTLGGNGSPVPLAVTRSDIPRAISTGSETKPEIALATTTAAKTEAPALQNKPVSNQSGAAETIPSPVLQPAGNYITPPPSRSSVEIYSQVSGAVVQIICEVEGEKLISGTGIIVSEKGIALTNAHVVERAKECLVRAGNPAYTIGKLKILFTPDTAEKISGTDVPRHDFAFGAIVSLNRAPAVFPYLTFAADHIPRPGNSYFTLGYAAEFVGAGGLKEGSQNLAYGVTRFVGYYPYGKTATDILEFSGNVTTQEGASGSPILMPSDGSVIGLVFGQNKKDEDRILETAKRIEFAFSVPYLDRSLRALKGVGLREYIEALDAAR